MVTCSLSSVNAKAVSLDVRTSELDCCNFSNREESECTSPVAASLQFMSTQINFDSIYCRHHPLLLALVWGRTTLFHLRLDKKLEG